MPSSRFSQRISTGIIFHARVCFMLNMFGILGLLILNRSMYEYTRRHSLLYSRQTPARQETWERHLLLI